MKLTGWIFCSMIPIKFRSNEICEEEEIGYEKNSKSGITHPGRRYDDVFNGMWEQTGGDNRGTRDNDSRGGFPPQLTRRQKRRQQKRPGRTTASSLRSVFFSWCSIPRWTRQTKGLYQALDDAGLNYTVDQQNASGDQPTCQTIASKLVNDGDDLILAIATPAAQAVAGATTDIPILLTAVTDPAESDLVESNDVPGGNVSGTSDLTPRKGAGRFIKADSSGCTDHWRTLLLSRVQF